MTLGQKIQKMRTDAGLSQTQLAEALTVSRSAVAKWENDNGTPDVENLKLVASYFHTDVDLLLDPTREVETPNQKPDPQPRPNTYCGKSCDQCGHKEVLACPGCKAGPGKRYMEKCEIAKCARERNTNACEHCRNFYVCATIRRKAKIPAIRLEQLKQENAKKERIQRVAPVGAKWFLILFWLSIVLEVCGILSSDFMPDIPALSLSIMILQVIALSVCGCIQLYLSKFESRFRIAGSFIIIAALFSLAMWSLGEWEPLKNWTPFLAIPAFICTLLSRYHEYTACADLVYEACEDTHDSWLMLRKFYFGVRLGVLACILLLMIAPVLALLGIIVCYIMMLVTTVMYFVCIRRTISAFRSYQ